LIPKPRIFELFDQPRTGAPILWDGPGSGRFVWADDAAEDSKAVWKLRSDFFFKKKGNCVRSFFYAIA
jgi:hypothetical protein